MANLNTGTYVTAKGKSLIAKAIATGTSIEFTRAAVGSGLIPEYIDKNNLTGLIDYKMDAAIASAFKEEDKAVISIQASSENVEEDFYITEVGVFANDPDEGEIFFGGMDVQHDTTLMYANGGGSVVKFAEYELILLVGSTATVTAIITPGAYASREDVEALQNPVFEDYTEESEVPSAETALSNIISGKSFKELWQNIKAFCMGVVTIAKISQNGAVTEVGKLVLDAIEKNPDIAGTLANMIKQNQTNISKLNADVLFTTTEYTSVADIVANTPTNVFPIYGSLDAHPLAEFSSAGWAGKGFLTGIIAKQNDNAYFLACVLLSEKKGMLAQGDQKSKNFNQYIEVS